jgi:hypothetical protein
MAYIRKSWAVLGFSMAGVVALALGCGLSGSENVDDSAGNLTQSKDLVINQVYTGGGSAGADVSAYKNDFVELFNAGEAVVKLKEYSLQYASAGSAFDVRFAKPVGDFDLEPGMYALIKLGNGGPGGADLPADHLLAVADINLKENTGKVAIVKTGHELSGCGVDSAAAHSDAGFTLCDPADWVDFVGYGPDATQSETSAAAVPNKKLSLTRVDRCKDTGDNSKDFVAKEASPHATGTMMPCSASGLDGGADAATDDAGPKDASTDAKSDGAANNNPPHDAGKDASTKPKKDASTSGGGDDDDDGLGENPGETSPPPAKPKPAPKAPLRNGASDCSMAAGPSNASNGLAAIGALAFAFASIGARRRSRSTK